jgi:2-polyprenyl-3-methyl-5-hydroxy-6-metoxy-1,4-benzoquinol methylase
LKDKLKKLCCELCGSSRYSLVYKRPFSLTPTQKSTYRISESSLEKLNKIVRCTTCGLVYAMPNVSVKAIVRDYVEMVDKDYLLEEKGRRRQAGIILSRIEKMKRRGKLLDIGCGSGLLLDEAKSRGWKVEGVDLSSWAKRYANEQFGIRVFQGSLLKAAYPDQSFDAIVMLDVIEHLEHPKEVLKEIRRILKHDGILYVSTPDIGSFWSRIFGALWWGINKYHLFYFSKKTIEDLFRKYGFESIRYQAHPRVFSVRYWSKRLKDYPFFLHLPFTFLDKKMGMGKKILKVVTHDQIDVIVRKMRTLDTVIVGKNSNNKPKVKSKVIAVLPAYNAERTLERTVRDIPREVVDKIILVDDASKDGTVRLARKLGLTVYAHKKNKGYGANQKTCYRQALKNHADIVVMVHPDYQYDPTIIPQLIEPIQRGDADAVFGSRMMKGGALEGGMPLWKHNANVLLTAFENVILGTYLSEYHSGFRAYSSRFLRQINLNANSDHFVFDTEIIVQALANHFKIDEIPIRTRYFEEASSIGLGRSILYGMDILRVMVQYLLHARGIWRSAQYSPLEKADFS